ncbi:hydroxymethylglutaryl-CoA lyase [Rhodobacteraceae bacterium Araon29]
MRECVVVREVGLRDGLQLVDYFVSTSKKKEWIFRQASLGFSDIEVTSFVPQKLLPQFADAAEIVEYANSIDCLTASALALNVKGAQRAMEAGARKICFVLSASEMHNQSNARCSTNQSIERLSEIHVWQQERHPETSVVAAIATSFGCSLQGNVPEKRVVEIAALLAEKGAREIVLADTVGYGNPKQVRSMFEKVRQEISDVPLAAHFHDTRAMGLANVTAALEADVRTFDAALGGLGGCPFAPGATGNIATEDTVYMLESMGLSTNVDVDGLIKLRKDFAYWLPKENLHGRLSRAKPAINFSYDFDRKMT